VVGGRVLGAMRRRSTDGSFKANISRGGDGGPFPLNSAIEDLALASASAVNLEIAGVDLLFDGDGYSVCEVNSAPGFAGFEQATGLNVAREILEHCCSRIEQHNRPAGSPVALTV
jgi:RimK family alpha-L-glutamate ligase